MTDTKKHAFTDKFLKKIETGLLAEKTKIEGDLKAFATKNTNVSGDYDADFPEYGDESDENAREIADYTTNKSLEITLEKTLRDIDKSIKRLAEGTYGICKYCDKPIDEKRLLARPTSGSCVECKKALTDEL